VILGEVSAEDGSPFSSELALAPSGQRYTASVLVPVLAAFAAGVHYAFANGVTISLLVALVLAPVWLTHLSRFRGILQILLIGVLAIISGVVLTTLDPLRATEVRILLLPSSFQLLSIISSIGMLVWVRGHLGPHVTAIVYGLGLIVNVVVTTGVSQTNAFKFSFSLPVVAVALGIAGLSKRRWAEVVWLVGLTGMMLVWADSRSMAAVLVMTIVVVLWQRLSRPDASWRARPWTTSLLLALFGLAVFQAMQAIILEGVLGEAAKDRSQLQIDTAGSVVAGGRPEVGATIALLRLQPWGFGSGVLPTSSDVWIAKSGMHELNYDPNNGYVAHYMFASGFEVHSVLGDLWIRFGIFGALLALAIVGYCIYSAASRISTRSASALLVFLTVNTVWDLMFTPLHTASNMFVLAVTLAALPRRTEPSPKERTPLRIGERNHV
jgi:hypothetical protein